MKKLKVAYLLAVAPLFMGADYGQSVEQLIVNSLPTCADSEYLVYTANGIACQAITGGNVTLPSCSATNQLLTYTMTGEIGVFSCTDKGTESLSSSDITTINNNYQTLINMETVIKNLETNPRAAAAKYCGSTTTTTVGRITANNGALVGLAAASNLCSQVASCGAGAHMCTVYEMFESVASGVVKQTDQIAKAWVYMASWQNFSTGAVEPTAGLNDNCGSYTYPTGDRQWQGTAVKWENDQAGDRTLKFYTGVDRTGIGNPSGNYEGAPCNKALPIACCK
jgi:hypothetical protein